MTVLMCVVAASIAFSVARQTVLSVGSAAARADARTGWRIAENTLADIEAQLAADPDVFMRRVLPQERIRVCESGDPAGATFTPGSLWPTDCGATWHYTDDWGDPVLARGVSRVEITPPSPSDPNLRIRVLSLAGGIDTGYDVVYARNGANRWTFATTGDLDMSDPSPAAGVSLTGSLYARGDVTVPASMSGPVTITDAYIATDSAFSGSLSESEQVVWLSPTPTAGSPDIANVRSIQPVPLTPGNLAAAAASLVEVGCPTGPNINIDDVTFSLCLRPGQELTDVDGGDYVVVPAGARSYMIVTQPATTAPPTPATVKIWTSPDPIDTSASSDLMCSPLPDCMPAPGENPGDESYWESEHGTFLGTFLYPSSGVIATDGDTQIGYCSGADLVNGDQYRQGDACATLSGSASGMATSQALTVIAGTLSDPKDLVVGTSIHAANGGVGLIATGRVVLPYWIHPAGTSTAIDANLVGLGLGDESSASVASFPAVAGGEPEGDSVTITGSVAGTALPFGIAGWANTTYTYAAPLADVPPWFSGVDPAWVRIGADRISGDIVCPEDGGRQCTDF